MQIFNNSKVMTLINRYQIVYCVYCIFIRERTNSMIFMQKPKCKMQKKKIFLKIVDYFLSSSLTVIR